MNGRRANIRNGAPARQARHQVRAPPPIEHPYVSQRERFKGSVRVITSSWSLTRGGEERRREELAQLGAFAGVLVHDLRKTSAVQSSTLLGIQCKSRANGLLGISYKTVTWPAGNFIQNRATGLLEI